MRAKPDGYAVASFVLGLIPVIPVIGSIVAVVFGFVSRGEAKRRGERPSVLSGWGIVMGFAAILVVAVVVVAVVAGSYKSPTQQWIDCSNNAMANGLDPHVVCASP